MRTIASELDRYSGIGPGFDALRLGLALAILAIHCFPIATGSTHIIASTDVGAIAPQQVNALDWVEDTFFHKHNNEAHFANVLVPMFFALSGFLVTGSAFRVMSVGRFLTFRILRIVPALFVEVSLSALVLGPLLTTMAFSDYVSDGRFLQYFGNIIGRVRFELPGVFTSNPTPDIVNSNLWTLPSEFYCYLIIAILMMTGLLFRRNWFSALCAVAAIGFIVFDVSFRGHFTSDLQRNTAYAVVFFFCGAAAFHWRDYIPFSRWLIAASVAVVYIAIIATPAAHSILQYVQIPFLTYLTVAAGFIKVPKLGPLQSGDYSYGIYLYGYPISQALVAAFEPLRGHPLYLMPLSLAATMMFAAASWWLFEKPALSLKRFVASVRLGPRSVASNRPT